MKDIKYRVLKYNKISKKPHHPRLKINGLRKLREWGGRKSLRARGMEDEGLLSQRAQSLHEHRD